MYVSIAAFTDRPFVCKTWGKRYLLLGSLLQKSSSNMCSKIGFILSWLSSSDIDSCVADVCGSIWSEILSEIWCTGLLVQIIWWAFREYGISLSGIQISYPLKAYEELLHTYTCMYMYIIVVYNNYTYMRKTTVYKHYSKS